MIHFDWDIKGINLETFSPETMPLQPCSGETAVTPEQVELFTSLLRQEAAAVETSSFRPTFPQSIISPEKPQNARQMPINMQVLSAQVPVNTPSITVKAPVYAPVQTTAPLEILESLETLETPAMAPAMENAKPSVKEPSTQVPVPQETVNTPSITVKASVYTPLQPMASLENLESLGSLEVLEALEAQDNLKSSEAPALAPAMANATLSVQIPVAQKLSTQIPVAQMPAVAQTQSAQVPDSMPHITIKASVYTPLQPMASLENLALLETLEMPDNLEALETPAIVPAMEFATLSVQQPPVQISTAHEPSVQMPMAQMPAAAQIQSSQVPDSMPITVKAPVSPPLQPMASPENPEALEVLEPLETPAMAPAMENTKPSVQQTSVQMPMPQKSSTQMPVAQMPTIAQTQFAQVSENTPSITVTVSVSTPLQSTAQREILDNQEPLEVLESPKVLENLKPLETAAMPTAMENAKPSVQIPVAQTPAIAQTQSAQIPTNTPSITVNASVSTPLQPMASLENLEPLETLETAAMPHAMENAMSSVQKASVQLPIAQKPSIQMPVQETVNKPSIMVTASVSTPLRPLVSLENLETLESLEVLEPLENLENLQPLETTAMAPATEKAMPSTEKPSTQMPVAQDPVNTLSITVTASVSTPLQPMAPIENLEPLSLLENPEPLDILETPAMAPVIENAKPSLQEPSVQKPTVLEPSILSLVMQKPLIAQTQSAQIPTNTPSITVKAFVSAPLQPMAPIEILENPEPLALLENPKPLDILETPAMAPAMENAVASVEVPSMQTSVAQKPLITQTQSAQIPTNTPYITVKASVSAPLQPMAPIEILENLEPLALLENLEPLDILETPAMAPVMENAGASVEVPSMQTFVAQKPLIAQTQSAQIPTNTPYITVKTSVSIPLQPMVSLESLDSPEHLVPLKDLEPLETVAMAPAMENTKPSVQIPMPQKPSVLLPTAQMSSMQMPVAQMYVITQMQSAQEPANAQYITVKAPVSAPLQPMASLESPDFLEYQVPLENPEPLETATMPPAMENTKLSVEVPSTQMPTAQMPITQMPVITQTAFTQMPFMAATNAPSMENAESSVQEAPIQIPTLQKPSVQIPTLQKPSTQMPVTQMPTIAQEHPAQVTVNTPYITVKASVSTSLQPMVSLEPLEKLESLEVLEPLVLLAHLENQEPLEVQETAAMLPAENAKPSVQQPSVQISIPRKSSAQVSVAQKPLTMQMLSAQESVNVPYITVKAPISTHLQPMAPLENLEPLESLEVLEPPVPLAHLEKLEPLESLETPTMPYATENARPSVQEASVQKPIAEQPFTQMPVAQKPIITQMPSAHSSASTPYITVKASVSSPQQPLSSLENLDVLDHLAPLESLEKATMPYAMENITLSTPISSAQKPFTAQTPSTHASTRIPYMTTKASHASTQKLEAPEKPVQKAPSMPIVDTSTIHAAATAISQPTDLAMPSVAPVKASSMVMPPAQILAETVNELTDAILVNIDENGHLGEIRLVLKPDVLDGTSILLKCDQKQVSVTFFPGAESAEQLLMANQGRIAETLAETGHLPVKISIINSEGRRQIRKTA